MRIQKRRFAGDAEEFGVERLRIVQAARAHRYSGNFSQGFAADAAIIGE
jgi:hypothetical protein